MPTALRARICRSDLLEFKIKCLNKLKKANQMLELIIIHPNWSTRVKVFNWPNTSTLSTLNPKTSWASSSILKISNSSVNAQKPLIWCLCRLSPLLSTCRRWAWMLSTCWRAFSSTRTCKLNTGSCRSNRSRWPANSLSNQRKLRMVNKTLRNRHHLSLKQRHLQQLMRTTILPNLRSSNRRLNKNSSNKLRLINKFNNRY